MESKDIQEDVIKICTDRHINNIYTQITYYLIAININKNNPLPHADGLSTIIGLLEDRYFGIINMPQHIKDKIDKK
jgi:hypothetical protein